MKRRGRLMMVIASAMTTVSIIAPLLAGVCFNCPNIGQCEWTYPNAKQVEGETWEEFLPWATSTTTDPFEKVWQFYWTKKITYPMPLPFNLKKRASASMGTLD